MQKNIETFGTMMATRMQQTVNAAMTTAVDLGTVNPNMSITPDSLGVPIPKGDYMVNLMLTTPMVTSVEEHKHDGGEHFQLEGSGSHGHSGGAHSHVLPSAHRGIEPGDRVLIAWCGNEAVVICIVVSS